MLDKLNRDKVECERLTEADKEELMVVVRLGLEKAQVIRNLQSVRPSSPLWLLP